MKITALVFALSYATARHSLRKFDKLNDFINDVSGKLQEASDYIEETVKPDLRHYEITGTDLRNTLKEVKWEEIDSWDDFKDVDWDLIQYRLEAIDKDNKVDWDKVKQRREKKFDRIDKKIERFENAQKKLDEIEENLKTGFDTDLMHQNIHNMKQDDVKVEWAKVNDQIENSIDTLEAIKWKDAKTKEGLDWNFIEEKVDVIINEINTNTETFRDSIKKVEVEAAEPELIPAV